MTIQFFLEELEHSLSGIPDEEKNRTLDYYREIIADAEEDGKTEEEIISSLDDPQTIAKNLTDDIPLRKFISDGIKQKRLSPLTIVMIILASPIWLPVLVSVFAVILSCYITLWAAVASFFAAFIGLAAGGIGFLVSFALILPENVPKAFMCLGTALTSMGVSVFVLFFSIWITKLLVKLTAFIGRFTKKQFIKKRR